MNEWNVGDLEGLIPLLGGIYGLLLAHDVIPINRRDPEKAELWKQKFGPMMKIVSPLCILFGVLHLIGLF